MGFHLYNEPVMAHSKVEAAQLQRRDPAAWTALMQANRETADEVVTAVQAKTLYSATHDGKAVRVQRYQLALAGHSDPISFICKQTSQAEVIFYRHLAAGLNTMTPTCWFAEEFDDQTGWLVLSDVPNHHPAATWTAVDMESVVLDMARQHARFHNKSKVLYHVGLGYFLGEHTYTWEELRREKAVYFEDGPAKMLSEHAIASSAELAPVLVQAANGLAVMRSLGGWPGILGESHLTAAADLIDDPLPMLETLRQLPVTLLHGGQHPHHWRMPLFDDARILVDWRRACVGPGICDLVNLLEQLDLLFDTDGGLAVRTRPERPIADETLIDTYMLAMHHQLGQQYDTRAVRLAIPAARCLYVLTNWFPLFATWFSDMPSKYTWQKINRMDVEQLMGTPFEMYGRLRPFLAETFARFLRASYMV